MFLLFVFLFVVLFVFFIKKYNNQIENVKKKSIKISETICNANIIESESGVQIVNPNGNNIIDKNQEDKTKNSDIANSFKFDKIFNKKKSHRLSFAEIDDIFASIYFRNNSKGKKKFIIKIHFNN
jgi:hypothetical protein